MMLSLLLGAATAFAFQQPRPAGPHPDTLPPEPAISAAPAAPIASAGSARGDSADATAPVVTLAGEPRSSAQFALVRLTPSSSTTLLSPAVSPAPSLHSTLMAPLWTRNAPALSDVDSIVVEKRLHRLTLFSHGVPLRAYLVALGTNPIGDKQYQGDNRTPEGVYHIEARNPESRYHKALRISYPDAAHLARAAALGRSPGGDIMIHGLPHGYEYVGAHHRDEDWTEGCIAVTNEEIDDIWRAVRVGTPIEIKP